MTSQYPWHDIANYFTRSDIKQYWINLLQIPNLSFLLAALLLSFVNVRLQFVDCFQQTFFFRQHNLFGLQKARKTRFISGFLQKRSKNKTKQNITKQKQKQTKNNCKKTTFSKSALEEASMELNFSYNPNIIFTISTSTAKCMRFSCILNPSSLLNWKPWIDEWTVEGLIEKQTLLQDLNFQVTFLAVKRFNEAGVGGILNWTFYSGDPFARGLYSMHWDELKITRIQTKT